MGNICASSQFTSEGGRIVEKAGTAKIIHLDGRLQELRHPVQAHHILSQNPNCFLCTSESMYVGSCAPHVPKDEELQLGQIYFLLPISHYSNSPLSLQDLCSLAIKASAALTNHPSARHVVSSKRSSPTSDRKNDSCRVPTGIESMVGMSSKVGRGNQRIELL